MSDWLEEVVVTDVDFGTTDFKHIVKDSEVNSAMEAVGEGDSEGDGTCDVPGADSKGQEGDPYSGKGSSGEKQIPGKGIKIKVPKKKGDQQPAQGSGNGEGDGDPSEQGEQQEGQSQGNSESGDDSDTYELDRIVLDEDLKYWIYFVGHEVPLGALLPSLS